MTIMLLPMLIVIFLIGWVMYWVGDKKIGDNKHKSPKQRKQPEQDNVTFMPVIFEEPEKIANS